jgi:TonB family protein
MDISAIQSVGANFERTVAFSISDGGALTGVRLAQSSGHTELDQQAVQIVSRTAFPVPPSGMSLISRTYVSAFTFR